VSARPMQLACANCFWLQQIRETGEGQCWRHPPQVIVLFSQRPDLASAAVQTMQAPTKVRPTMTPTEFCGDFMPCDDMMQRSIAAQGASN